MLLSTTYTDYGIGHSASYCHAISYTANPYYTIILLCHHILNHTVLPYSNTSNLYYAISYYARHQLSHHIFRHTSTMQPHVLPYSCYTYSDYTNSHYFSTFNTTIVMLHHIQITSTHNSQFATSHYTI